MPSNIFLWVVAEQGHDILCPYELEKRLLEIDTNEREKRWG
jgi:hypothetical protein